LKELNNSKNAELKMEKKIFFSIKTLIVNNNKFLAVYNFENGQKLWDLPGGKMEFGETAEESLKREIFEELGIEIIPIKVIDTWNYIHDENCQITGIIYFSEVKTDKIRISEEHDGFDWIGFEQIDEIFTGDFLLDKMQLWDWDSIIDNKVKFTKSVIISNS
jgi:8-oxo-dGTP diphosphatase